MDFAQKIYYNNKPLILTSGSKRYIADHAIAGGYLVFKGAFPDNYRLAREYLDKQDTFGAVIEDISLDSLQKELHNMYDPIDAGGGVVMNEKGEILMIYRRGKWDLPKGKRDDGEDITQCALREVSEETGLQRLQLAEKICDTYHIYSQNKQNLLKRTTWYKMKASSSEKLTPQKEENILEARWIHPGDLRPFVNKSYEAIKEVLQQAGFK